MDDFNIADVDFLKDRYEIYGCCGHHVVITKREGVFIKTYLKSINDGEIIKYDPHSIDITERNMLIFKMAKTIPQVTISKILNMTQARVSQVLNQ